MPEGPLARQSPERLPGLSLFDPGTARVVSEEGLPAAEALARARCAPATARDHCDLGTLLLASGDIAGTSGAVVDALRAGGSDLHAVLRCAELCEGCGRTDDARALCRAVGDSGTPDGDLLVRAGDLLLRLAGAEGAALCWFRALRANPDHAGARDRMLKATGSLLAGAGVDPGRILVLARMWLGLGDPLLGRRLAGQYMSLRQDDADARELFAAANTEVSRAECGMGEVAEALPSCILLDPTDRCNASCIMCGRAYTRAGSAQGDMERSVFGEIAKIMPAAVQVNLFSVGEPFLADDFEYFLRETLRCSSPSARVWLSTNGKAVSDSQLSASMAPQVVFQFSVDGGTPAVFESIRRGIRFDDLLSTLVRFRATRGASRFPALVFSVTVSRRNLGDLRAIFSQAKEFRADSVFLSPMSSPLQGVEEDQVLDASDEALFMEQLPDLVASGVPFENGLPFGRTGGAAAIAPNSGDAPPRPSCAAPWRVVNVRSNGDVMPCCVLGETMGNLREKSFEAVWNGPEYRALRRSFLTQEGLRPVCRACIHPMRRFGER